MQEQITMDMLLKMKPEDFRDTVSKETLGFCSSLQNLIKAQFEQCNLYKESLLRLLEADNVPKQDIKEIKSNLDQLYLCLQLLEDRHTILDLVIKEKRIVKH